VSRSVRLRQACSRQLYSPVRFRSKMSRMGAIGKSCLVTLLAITQLWAASAVPLRLEERTILHVGQVAILHTQTNHRDVITSEGDAIIPVEQARNGASYLYRAVRPGNAALLATPADLKQGDCVSCVTRHYFVTVIP